MRRLFIAAVLASVCAASPAAPVSAASSSSRSSSIESRILSLINSGRARSHRPTLSMQSGLRSVARSHSRYMASIGRLTHAGFEDRIARYHGAEFAACENVAYYQPATDPGDAALAQHLYDQWYHSSPHRKCMLDSRNYRTNTAGVGIYRDAAGRWWATLEALRNGR